MAILYKKPKLRVISSLEENLLSINFKLDFQPCIDILEINLNFIDEEKYQNKHIASINNTFTIRNTTGLGYTLDTTQKYLKGVNLFIINSDEFILDFLIKEFPLDNNEYIIFSIRESNLFFVSEPNIEILIPKSDMKKICNFEISSEYTPIIGTSYISEEKIDIKDGTSIEPDLFTIEGISYPQEEGFNLDINNFIDHTDGVIPYIDLVEGDLMPSIQFDQALIQLNEGEFDQDILITRMGDISQNSLIRIDIISATSTIPDDVIVYSQKYIRFFSNEDEKFITIAALSDLEIESTENLILKITPEDNCIIGDNSELTVEILNV